MKRFLCAAALIVVAAPALTADMAMSISIGQPGFYGQIDIGGYPPPRVLYRQPIMVERVEMDRPPIYLRVPPGYAKNWRNHCDEYNACGERVYFVQNNWYHREYVPRYQERHYEYRDEHRGNSRNNQNDRSNWNDHPGNSQGKGHNR